MFWKPPSNSDHLDLAPLGFDYFFGLTHRPPGSGPLGDTDGTLTEKLDPDVIFFDETGSSVKASASTTVSAAEPGQIPNIDNSPGLFEDIGKTSSGQTPDEGHLTAFKSRTDFSSGT